jgi:hypothetical protein
VSTALVSIIIPCYNLASYLPRAIESVREQTFDDWEAIVVDDGSPDNTASVAARYTAVDPRIHYLCQPNRGVSAARNTGIRAARGRYLVFLDADDELAPEFLRTCLSTIPEDSRVAGVYTQHQIIDESGQLLVVQAGDVLAPNRLHARLLQGGLFPPHCVLTRAAIVRRAGMFDESIGASVEDWDLWLRVCACGVLLGIAKPLVRYRVRSGSASTLTARMLASTMAVLAKHFGPPEGDPAAWPEDKRRAYACAHRGAALGYIAQGQAAQGWALLAQGARLWPALLAELDTHYELACWDQPRGYRGEASLLDLDRHAALLLDGLRDLFARGDATLAPYRRSAFGQAHLALAMLADQAGRWGLARSHLAKSLRYRPGALADAKVMRRLLKLYLGRRAIAFLRARLGLPHTEALW